MKFLEDARNDREAVFLAIGAASMCWENVGAAGIFDSTQAKVIGEELMGWVNRPRLGYATTLDLINELHARAMVGTVTGEEWPHYQTVGDV